MQNPLCARLALSLALLATLAACDSSKIPGNRSEGGGTPGVDPPPPVAGPKTCITNADNIAEMASDMSKADELGAFTVPFCEEKALSDYADEDIPRRDDTVRNDMAPSYSGLEHCARRSDDHFYECKPTAGSIALLPDNRLLYFNALESTENVEFNIVKEYGEVSVNDQTRVMTMHSNNTASWIRPINVDGGAKNPTNDTGGGAGDPATGISPDDAGNNDGALFCAHLINLYDGRVMAAGGTDYYTEAGAVELEGLKNTRIFNPANNTWTQADLMSWGRWYPTLTTFANGHVFVVSGVRKLLKPVYPDRPADESGRNETHVEIFQPGCNNGAGKWTDQGSVDSSVTGIGPRRSLPLFSRMHLLPNDEALYAAGGQAFNPAGQSYDQAITWDQAAVFNKGTQSWRTLGIPGSPPFMGFRGSTTSVMLPLVPDANGAYNQANLLTAGGTYGLSPGNPDPLVESRIDTYNLVAGVAQPVESRDVGSLNVKRWYGHGLLLPTGQVMWFSGADFDEVISPGAGAPILEPEMFDPVTEEWTVMAPQGKARTYHNSAVLMPDGRVLIGGHGPISNNYSRNTELPTKSPQGRDPSFELYSPTYMFKPRPSISSVSANTVMPGSTLTISTPNAASVVNDGYAVLVRRTAITHLVDGDQRNVVLKINSSTGSSLTVQIPNNKGAENQAVVPPGHYMLFIVNKSGDALVPSVSVPVQVLGADLSCV